MTSAEAQGNALADWLLDNGRVPIITHETRAKIIEALREAGNAKLEEAAAMLTAETSPKPGKSISVGDELLMHGAAWCSDRIRSLIEKDTA